MKKKVTKAEIEAKAIQKRKEYMDRINKSIEIKKQRMLKSVRIQYASLMKAQTDKVIAKYQTKLDRRLKRIERDYEARKNRNIKVKVYKKEIKQKLPTIAKMKSLALMEIQKYAKLSRCVVGSKSPQVYLIDKMERTSLNKNVNGGHVFGQRNYPSLAFDIKNIRPITNWTNKRQGDQIANWIVNLPYDIQKYLQEKSEDTTEKNNLRDHKFYQDIIDKYKKLNEIEIERLGMN